MKAILTILVATLALSACGNNTVPQDIVDQNMTITRLNSQKNANSYFPEAWPPGTVDARTGAKPMRVLMQSDSTVSVSCRNGDGWASCNIEFENGSKLEVK